MGNFRPRQNLRFGYVCGALRVSLDDHRGSIGPRAHVSGFLNGLRAVGVDPAVYLAGDDWVGRHTGDSVDTEASPNRILSAAHDLGRLALRSIINRRAARTLGPIDIVYERLASFQDIGRKFQRRGVPWILESNGPFWYEAKVERRNLAFSRIAKKLELGAYRDADLVVVVSEALKEIVATESGRRPDDIIVLPNATDTRRFDPSRVEAKRLMPGVVIGFCGFLTRWAGVDLLLQAVAELRERGDDLSVVLIGDGPQREELASLSVSLNIESHVKFTGPVAWSEVPGLLAGFDAAYSGQRTMAIGSMYHSPQKLYEYQAMGLPTVASDHSDARRLVTPDRGWLFPSEDVSALAKALHQMVISPNRQAMGMSARSAVIFEETWESRVSSLLDTLEARGLLHRS